MRKETGENRWTAPMEVGKRDETWSHMLYDVVASPFIILFEVRLKCPLKKRNFLWISADNHRNPCCYSCEDPRRSRQLFFNSSNSMLFHRSTYTAFIYGCVYLLCVSFWPVFEKKLKLLIRSFGGLPFIFIGIHGFNTGEEGLVFLALFTFAIIADMM